MNCFFCLLTLLFCTVINLAEGVFTDEVNVNDWSIRNVGSYNCILSTNKLDQLVFISDSKDKNSIISFVNKATGNIDHRFVLKDDLEDVILLKSNELIIKHNSTYFGGANLSIGFEAKMMQPLNYSSEWNIFSSCSTSNVTKFELENSQIALEDEVGGKKLVNLTLPDNFNQVNYIGGDLMTDLELIVSNAHHDTYLFLRMENNELVKKWFRDESISNANDFFFIDINTELMPSVTNEAINKNGTNCILSYWFRLKINYHRLLQFIKTSNYSPGQIVTNALTSELNFDMVIRPIEKKNVNFGLKQVLVVLTKNNQLKGLDLANFGETLWCIDVNELGDKSFLKMEWFNSRKELFIFTNNGFYIVYRLSNHLLPPVMIKEDRFTSNCEIKSFSKLESDNDLDGKFYIEHPASCHLNNRIIDVLDTNHVLETSFITYHDEFGVYGHISDADGNLKRTWQITVDQDIEKIVAFKQKNNNQIINQGVVMNNGDVLYKYLYPNMASYIVYNKVNMQISIHIIDTITGELLATNLHDKEHVDASLNVNIIFGEYWIIYSYFSLEPTAEQKINVVELYESLTPNERVSSPNEIFSKVKQIRKPVLKSLSFLFPEIIRKLSISTTKFGITTKAIILELENGQITFIPKTALDATKELQNEQTDAHISDNMTSFYTATIPINDFFVITHAKDFLFGDNSVLTTVDTSLESTSIVCNLGHDIFCTRIVASGQFDVMNFNFESYKLLITLLICVVLCLILKPKISRKLLKNFWLVRD